MIQLPRSLRHARYLTVLCLRFALLSAGAACLAACGGSASEPEGGAAPLRTVAPGTWVVMGSSTAEGAGASPGKAWVSLLQAGVANRAVNLVNIARGGSTTYAGLATSTAPTPDRPALDPSGNIDAALALAPKLLLLNYPGNDTALGYSADETVRNLLAIRAAALADGVAVIVLSTQPRTLPPHQLAVLAQIDAQLESAVAPCSVALRAALEGPGGAIDPRFDAGDGVHLNDVGHALIHARVRALIDAGQCVRAAPP